MTDLNEKPGHLSKAKYVCQEGWELQGTDGAIETEVVCYAHGETPAWKLPTGNRLPKCVRPCSQDADCDAASDECDEKRHTCQPTLCPER